MTRPLTAVLMGGVSPEHPVSLETGRAVVSALARLEFAPVIEALILLDGSWRLDGGPPQAPAAALSALRRLGVRCCFLAVHGRGGEDGTLQGFLETAGLAYTGSRVAASAVAMSKSLTRAVLAAARLPIAPGLSLPAGALREQFDAVASGLRFPIFLKEDHSGSSLGVFKVHDRTTLAARIAPLPEAARLVLEEAVDGLEASVGVLGNRGRAAERLQALPPVEIRPRCEFFDYEAKYLPARAEETCPPRELDPEQVRGLQTLARRVHHELGCDGASRTDFIVGPDGPVILECNTLPGLTPGSLLPLAARAAGIGFPELVLRLIELALESHEGQG